MPKAELHLHLDGSLRPTTALELARQRGIDDGMDLTQMAARLQAPAQVADQAQLLDAFEMPIRLMQDAAAIERIAHELVLDVASDGTRYAEIRWAPALHVAGELDLAGSIAAVAAGVESGVAAARTDGETGVEVRLVCCAMRSHPPQLNLAVALEAAAFVGRGVVGFDLAGREAEYPDPAVHRDAFEAARAAGLGITLHAGEWGGAAQVRRALEIDPSRIAHGAPAADDPALIADLIARGVTLDLCPTSNVQAAIYPSLADHPLARLLRAGVPLTLSTDDRTVSELTLVREYENAVGVLGVTLAELWAMNMHALNVAFLHHDEPLRARLVAEFEAAGRASGTIGTG